MTIDTDTDVSMPEIGDDVASVASKLSALLSAPQGGARVEGDDEDKSSQEGASPSDDDAPAREQASEESKGEDEPEVPAIDPPSSWDAQSKEKFKALPPDLQEYISTREQERERVTNTRLQEASEQRRAIEAAAAQTAQMRDAYEQRLIAFSHHLNSAIPEEFRGIKSEADLVKLADSNPALVTKFNAWRQQLAAINNEMLEIEHQRAAETDHQRQTVLQNEFSAIAEKWPDFVDEAKGKAIKSEMVSYARERGFNDQEIASLVDHRLVLILKDAMAGQKAMQAAQQVKQKVAAKPLPKVVKPGSGEQTGKGAGVDRGQARRVAQSGDVNDIARTLERMLSS